jgi:hypothetical protein
LHGHRAVIQRPPARIVRLDRVCIWRFSRASLDRCGTLNKCRTFDLGGVTDSDVQVDGFVTAGKYRGHSAACAQIYRKQPSGSLSMQRKRESVFYHKVHLTMVLYIIFFLLTWAFGAG